MEKRAENPVCLQNSGWLGAWALKSDGPGCWSQPCPGRVPPVLRFAFHSHRRGPLMHGLHRALGHAPRKCPQMVPIRVFVIAVQSV